MRYPENAAQQGYKDINYFRMVAALLVVAIHTSPLWSYSQLGDFILTRMIARVAVPFFFMTTGFFVLGKYCCNLHKLGRFLRKIGIIYGLSILFYLPINIYQGDLSGKHVLSDIIRNLFLDGTIYHLWYLPATILGTGIVYALVNHLGKKATLVIVSLLYLIGLFGDSYYGFIQKTHVLKAAYGQWFQLSEYTRNGIFFAPLFIFLGTVIYKLHRQQALYLVFGCFAAMLGESLLLHYLDVQKHDSMYLFLPGLLYGMFYLLIQRRGEHKKYIGQVSLLIYLVHPMVIIVLHFITAKIGVLNFATRYSFWHFLIVLVVSTLLSIGSVYFFNTYCGLKRKRNTGDTDRAWLEINRESLRKNIHEIKKIMPKDCSIMAVAKANCYGHGGRQMVDVFQKEGIQAYAVASLEEGIQLRKNGAEGEILIMGYTNVNQIKKLIRFDLTQTLISYEYARKLNQQKELVKCHLKIDTGMHRMGYSCEEIEEMSTSFRLPNLQIEGIYTHLCDAENIGIKHVQFTLNQIGKFYECIDLLKERDIRIPKIHIQSSYGVLNYPKLKCDYARIGLSLYGIYSQREEQTVEHPQLHPAMSLYSRVALIRKVQKGEGIGYDQSYVADSERIIGIVPIGYADGIPRQLSMGKGSVYINHMEAPIIGKICMDQMAIDLTSIPDAKVGTVVTIFGKDNQKFHSIEDFAYESGSITNEIVSRLGSRLKILYIN